MFYYENAKTFEVYNVTFGRKGGENPLVVLGSIFHKDDKLVSNHKKGEFDKKKAKELIQKHEEIVRGFGLQPVLDVHGQTPEALKNYFKFVLDASDEPIIIDGTIPSIRLPVVELANELGASDRVIYDAINPDAREDELEVLKNNKITCAFLLALNQVDMTPKGRISIIKEKLLPNAEKAGITKPLLDTIVFDPPSLGLAAKAIELVKKEFGYPSGNGAVNAVELIGKWPYSKASLYSFATALYATNVVYGADWIFYGSLQDVEYIIPGLAIVDGIYAYTMRMMGHSVKLAKNHPLYKTLNVIKTGELKDLMRDEDWGSLYDFKRKD